MTAPAPVAAVLLAAFLLAAFLAGAAPPEVGPELPMDEPVLSPSPFAGTPDVTYGGTVYMTVWNDARGIYGARVKTDGTNLDPLGITISPHLGGPGAASNGNDFLVAFSSTSTLGPALEWAGVAAQNGGIISRYRYPIANPIADEYARPAVAFGRDTFLIVWWQKVRPFERERSSILGWRVRGSNFTPIDPAPFVIASNVGDEPAPRVAGSSTGFLVVWSDKSTSFGTIKAARVGLDRGLPDGPGGFVISNASMRQTDPEVATDFVNYFVVWSDSRAGVPGRWDIYGARVNQDGTLVDGPPDTGGVAISTDHGAELKPAVSFAGSGWAVAWEHQGPGTNQIFARRVDPRLGTMTDPMPLTDPSDAAVTTKIGYEGTTVLVVWRRFPRGDLRASRIRSPDFSLVDPVMPNGGILISKVGNRQGQPAAAACGKDAVIVWSDDRTGESAIYGMRIDRATQKMRETEAVRLGSGVAPAVSCGGGYAVAVWQRLMPAGAPADIVTSRALLTDAPPSWSDPISLSTPLSSFGTPSVACTDQICLAAWASAYAIRYARIGTTDGRLLDPPGGIAINGGPATEPAVTAGVDQFLLAWRDARNHASSGVGDAGVPTSVRQFDLFTTRIRASDGQTLDRSSGRDGVSLFASGSDSVSTLAATTRFADGTAQYFVAWAVSIGVLAKRIALDGTELDADPKQQVSGVFASIAVAWSKPDYFLAFNTGASITAVRASATSGAPLMDLQAGPMGLLITPEPSQDRPAIAAFDDGVPLVVYTRSQSRDRFASPRVFGAFVGKGATGPAPDAGVGMQPSDAGFFPMDYMPNRKKCGCTEVQESTPSRDLALPVLGLIALLGARPRRRRSAKVEVAD